MINKMNITELVMIRFWSKVNVPDDWEEHPEKCWEWKGGYTTRGYGDFSFESQHTRAHRFIYEFYYGIIPKDHHILHKCDNRKCVNPNHLYAGTQTNNTKDMLDRNRQAIGSKIGISTITEEQILEILEGIKNKFLTSREQICNKYNITLDTLDYFLRKNGWKHVTNQFSKQDLQKLRLSINQTSKLCEDDVKNIKNDLKNNIAISNIAAKYSVSTDVIYKIKNHKIWVHVTV